MTKQLTLKQISPIQLQVNALVVKDAATLKTATEYLSQANILLDNLVSDKETITKPLLASLKKIREKYKPMESALSDIIDAIRGKMTVYATDLAKLEERIADKAESGYITPETALKKLEALPATEATTASGSVQFVEVKCFEVISLPELPITFHLADEVAIRKEMLAGRQLPGVRYFTECRPRNSRN